MTKHSFNILLTGPSGAYYSSFSDKTRKKAVEQNVLQRFEFLLTSMEKTFFPISLEQIKESQTVGADQQLIAKINNATHPQLTTTLLHDDDEYALLTLGNWLSELPHYLKKPYYNQEPICAYFVDLNHFSLAGLKADLNDLKAAAPFCKIQLIALDKKISAETIRELKTFTEDNHYPLPLFASIDDECAVQGLFTKLLKAAKATAWEETIDQSMVSPALKDAFYLLKKRIAPLPKADQDKIEHYSKKLLTMLQDQNTYEEQLKAIKSFSLNSEKTIKASTYYSKSLMHAIASVSIAAVTAVTAGVVAGLTLGLMLGFGLSPAAALASAPIALAASMFAGSLALASTNTHLIKNGLFTRNVHKAINNVCAKAKDEAKKEMGVSDVSLMKQS